MTTISCTAAITLNVTVGVPHASVAVAEPSEAVISVGITTKCYIIIVTGKYWRCYITVQVTVLVMVAVLPQASTAVNVLVCERLQPLLVTAAITLMIQLACRMHR